MAKKKIDGFGFNEHIRTFFMSPDEFFDGIKSESFLTSLKYFGLFFLLTVLGNVFFGKPVNVTWGLFAGILLVMLLFLYLLLPFLLTLSVKFFGGKYKFREMLKLYGYNASYLLVVSMCLRVILVSLMKLGENIYLSFFVSAGQFFVVVVFLMAFFYYGIIGLQKLFDLSAKKSFWSFVLFAKMIFALIVISGFIFFGVAGFGNTLF